MIKISHDLFSNIFQTLFRQCSDSVQTFQKMFRMFRICSDFSNNAQNLFRLQTMLRMFRICSEFSVNVQNVQNLFRLFSEFLAQKLVYSEFLDFVVFDTPDLPMCPFVE